LSLATLESTKRSGVDASIAARSWREAPAQALACVLDWAEAGGDALVSVDRQGRVIHANAAFRRVFAVALDGSDDGAVPAQIARFVPLLSAPRLARWREESEASHGHGGRVHRLLAECTDLAGDRFLSAVTLLRAADAEARHGASCVAAIRPLDAPRGLRGKPIAAMADAVPDRIDLDTFVEACLRALPDPDARRRCRASAGADDARLDVDPEPVRDALLRVLDNACRYSSPETTVRVRTRVEAVGVGEASALRRHGVVTIADRGKGLSRAHAQRAFEPFWRAPERSQGPGQGLGLAIARHLIDAQGGWIELRSELGVGTEVEIWLPLAD
jgi:hypothetical protein